MDGRRRRCEPASQNPAYRPTRPPRTLQGRSAVPPSENVIRTAANTASMTDRGHVRFVEPLSEDAASGLGGDRGPPRRPRDAVEIGPGDHWLCPPGWRTIWAPGGAAWPPVSRPANRRMP